MRERRKQRHSKMMEVEQKNIERGSDGELRTTIQGKDAVITKPNKTRP